VRVYNNSPILTPRGAVAIKNGKGVSGTEIAAEIGIVTNFRDALTFGRTVHRH
jgi:hypothetical protein